MGLKVLLNRFRGLDNFGDVENVVVIGIKIGKYYWCDNQCDGYCDQVGDYVLCFGKQCEQDVEQDVGNDFGKQQYIDGVGQERVLVEQVGDEVEKQ